MGESGRWIAFAAVGVLILGAGTVWKHDSRTTPPARPGPAFLDGARIAPGGALEVRVLKPSPCSGSVRTLTVESRSRVTVRAWVSGGSGRTCAAVIVPTWVPVDLERPLGDRTVFDARTQLRTLVTRPAPLKFTVTGTPPLAQ